MESNSIIRNSFSYSQLNTFKTCPQKYKIIYIDGVRKSHESIEAFVGKRVHEVLEWLYKNENIKEHYITFDRLCQIYDTQWAAAWHQHIYIADASKQSDFYYLIGQQCLSNYYSRYGPKFDQQVVETEVALNFLIGNYHFKGIIDRLDHLESGEWVVHDYKTTKHPKSEAQAKNDIQLALYQIAIEQNYSQVNEICLTWHFLRVGSEIKVIHTRDQLEKLKNKIIHMTDGIIQVLDNENNFLPKETMLCNWCYLWEECTAKIGPNLVKQAV